MASEQVLGFRIEVKGTDEQTSKMAQLTVETNKMKQAVADINKQERDYNKGKKDAIALTQKQINLRQQLTGQIKANTIQYNNLSKEQLKNNGIVKSSTGFYGGFKKAITSSVGVMFGWTAAIGAVAAITSKAFNIFVDFDKASSKLEAVLSSTFETVEDGTAKMTSLREQAKELGSTTAFTATQVLELQTEFAKLGFPTEEIINMTESTLNASAALGSELGEQAALTGAVLKQYSKDSIEAGKVNDVLAQAASNSALDFQKLSTALPIVGATANAAGVSLEKTTALLGTLSDRGIDASTSATSLRNIFLTLSAEGISYEAAMAKINNATDKNAASFELFGKRGATAGVILAETGVSAKDLEDKLLDADGAAKKMADTMLDNLSGDITIANSAFEGFILSLEDGQGALSKGIRSVTQMGTAFLGLLTDINNGKSDLEIFANFGESFLVTSGAMSKEQAKIYGDITRNNAKLQEDSKLFRDNLIQHTSLTKELQRQLKANIITQDEYNQAILKLGNGWKRGAEESTKATEVIDENINEQIVAAEKAAAEQELKDKEAADKKEKEDKKRAKQQERDAKKQAEDIEKARADGEKKGQEFLLKQQQEYGLTKNELAALNLKREFDEKINAITGQSTEEIALRKALEEQKKIALDEQALEFKIADDEKEAAKDLEERQLELDNELLKAGEDYEARKLVLEKQRQLELSQKGLTKAQIEAINIKYNASELVEETKQNEAKKKLADAEAEAKIQSLQIVSNALSVAAGFAKEGSKQQRILASASALVSTYLSAQQAYASQFLPIPTASSPLRAVAASGVAIASGLGNVARINGVTFQDGGLVEGASHNQGGIQMYHKSGQHLGEMEGNEYIISSKKVSELGKDYLDSLNFGTTSTATKGYFANGGSVPTVSSFSRTLTEAGNSFDMNQLAEIITKTTEQTILRTEIINNATETAGVANEVINTENGLSFG